MKHLTLSLVLVLLFAGMAQADRADRMNLIKDSVLVMDEILDAPDGIPPHMLLNAKAIIIFPTMLKGGFLIAARYGQGIATVRSSETNSWSPPAFLTTVGGSFGFQIGAQAVDLVLLVMTQRGIEGLLKNQFTLGADVAITAGPVGRYAEAGTDILLQGEIYSYSRSKGIFAGVSLKGAVITANNDANYEYYRKPFTAEEILITNQVTRIPKSTTRFIKSMNALVPSYQTPDRLAQK